MLRLACHCVITAHGFKVVLLGNELPGNLLKQDYGHRSFRSPDSGHKGTLFSRESRSTLIAGVDAFIQNKSIIINPRDRLRLKGREFKRN